MKKPKNQPGSSGKCCWNVQFLFHWMFERWTCIFECYSWDTLNLVKILPKLPKRATWVCNNTANMGPGLSYPCCLNLQFLFNWTFEGWTRIFKSDSLDILNLVKMLPKLQKRATWVCHNTANMGPGPSYPCCSFEEFLVFFYEIEIRCHNQDMLENLRRS